MKAAPAPAAPAAPAPVPAAPATAAAHAHAPAHGHGPVNEFVPRNVFVRGVAGLKEEEVKAALGRFGAVASVNMGHATEGWVYAEFETEEACAAAVAAGETRHGEGHHLSIKARSARVPSGGRGGYVGGRGGGGGGGGGGRGGFMPRAGSGGSGGSGGAPRGAPAPRPATAHAIPAARASS